MRTFGFLAGSVAVALVWLFLEHQAGGLPAPTLGRDAYLPRPANAAPSEADQYRPPPASVAPSPGDPVPDGSPVDAPEVQTEPAMEVEAEPAPEVVPGSHPEVPDQPVVVEAIDDTESEGPPIGADTRPGSAQVIAGGEPPETMGGPQAEDSGPAATSGLEQGGRWEAFFTPFRSEASADGFARFLQAATGRDFRVLRAGPGQYRVWFSLDEGESRPERLAEIESVTGMVLTGGEL